MKIALGTAQLGFEYGIANTVGRVSHEDASRILDLAERGGVKILDTAPGVAGTEIRLAELVPRGETAARFLLGFATGVMVSVEHDGDRTHLQIIPPAA